MKIKLEQMERETVLWKRIAAGVQEEIDTQRRKNDGVQLTEGQTQAIRGRIAALKDLLAIGEDVKTGD